MAIGDKIFQLSMGIIQAERQRKQLELQTEALDQRQKQAEELMSLREAQLASKEGFLKIQQEQLKLQQESQALKGPEAELRQELTRAQIDLTKAQTQKALRTETSATSAAAQRTAGMVKSTVDKTARDVRTNGVMGAILRDDAASTAALVPRGVDLNPEVLKLGLTAANATTLQGLTDALQSTEKDIRATLGSFQSSAMLPKVKALESKRDQIQRAITEAQKVFQPTPSREEFLSAAEGSVPADFAQELYDNVVPAGAMRQTIWGGAVNTQQYEISIQQLLRNDTSTFKGFLRSQPGSVLTPEGVFRPPSAAGAGDGGAAELGQLLIAEGIPEATIRQLIGEMSRESAQ